MELGCKNEQGCGLVKFDNLMCLTLLLNMQSHLQGSEKLSDADEITQKIRMDLDALLAFCAAE